MSASPKAAKPLSFVQFWVLIVALAASAVGALVAVGGVAGTNRHCPGQTQVSRPAASICFSAYRDQNSTGVAGIPAISTP